MTTPDPSTPAAPDPDALLYSLLEITSSAAVRDRAMQIGALFRDHAIPGDAHTFVALVLVLAGADTLSMCPLGPERVSALVHAVRTSYEKIDRPAAPTSTPAERAKLRPANYAELPEETKWKIDKALGILDWDGK